MSGRDNGMNNASFGFAVVGTGLLLIGFFLFALAAFVALAFTVLAFMAWNSPLQLGKATIYPEEAHEFIYGGLTGAFVLPVFAAFCTVLFTFQIEDSFWLYLIMGGYTAGSLGTITVLAEMEEAAVEPNVIPPALPPQASVPAERKPPRGPFEFADWDDEELR